MTHLVAVVLAVTHAGIVKLVHLFRVAGVIIYMKPIALYSDKLCQGCFRKNRIITKGRMVLKLLSRGNGDFGLVLLFQISVVHERPPSNLNSTSTIKILTVFPGWIILIFKESLNWTIPK